MVVVLRRETSSAIGRMTIKTTIFSARPQRSERRWRRKRRPEEENGDVAGTIARERGIARREMASSDRGTLIRCGRRIAHGVARVTAASGVGTAPRTISNNAVAESEIESGNESVIVIGLRAKRSTVEIVIQRPTGTETGMRGRLYIYGSYYRITHYVYRYFCTRSEFYLLRNILRNAKVCMFLQIIKIYNK